MPPLALISLTASLKPATSASPYAAAVPELVVMDPSVMVSLLAALPLELLESSMLPPEQAARDIDMAPAAIRATHLAENFAFIPFFLFSLKMPHIPLNAHHESRSCSSQSRARNHGDRLWQSPVLYVHSDCSL